MVACVSLHLSHQLNLCFSFCPRFIKTFLSVSSLYKASVRYSKKTFDWKARPSDAYQKRSTVWIFHTSAPSALRMYVGSGDSVLVLEVHGTARLIIAFVFRIWSIRFKQAHFLAHYYVDAQSFLKSFRFFPLPFCTDLCWCLLATLGLLQQWFSNFAHLCWFQAWCKVCFYI